VATATFIALGLADVTLYIHDKGALLPHHHEHESAVPASAFVLPFEEAA